MSNDLKYAIFAKQLINKQSLKMTQYIQQSIILSNTTALKL